MTAKEKLDSRRKVLFLYPNIEDFSDNTDREKIVDLVNSLYYIIADANKFVTQAFSSDVFVNSRYIPVIEAQAVNKMQDDFCEDDIHGLRLCVTSFDNCDFSDKYNKLISKKKLDENDISHLLSLKLFSNSKKYSWKACEGEAFSAVVETGVNELTQVIVSVMLDIALYHYFKLPNRLDYRQSFGLTKKDFIDASLSKQQMKSVYGSAADKREGIRYLPISLQYIDSIKEDFSQMQGLLDDFTGFYYGYVIPFALVDKKNNIIDFKIDDEMLPNDNLDRVKKLLAELSEPEKNEIIDLFKNISDPPNADDKIILLLCEKTIFPYMNTKSRRFLVEKSLKRETYINMESFYILFRLKDTELDEV